MKAFNHISLAALLLAGLPVGSYAQQVRFGVKAGGNLANIVSPSEANYATAGALGGGFVNVPLAKHWSLQPELLYSMQGYQYYGGSGGGFGPGRTYHVRLRYLQLPLLLQTRFDGTFLELGPQLGTLASAGSRTVYRPFDFSVAAGAGHQFRGPISIGVRYTRSVRNIYRQPEAYSYPLQGYHKVGQLYVAYVFGRKE